MSLAEGMHAPTNPGSVPLPRGPRRSPTARTCLPRRSRQGADDRLVRLSSLFEKQAAGGLAGLVNSFGQKHQATAALNAPATRSRSFGER